MRSISPDADPAVEDAGLIDVGEYQGDFEDRWNNLSAALRRGGPMPPIRLIEDQQIIVLNAAKPSPASFANPSTNALRRRWPAVPRSVPIPGSPERFRNLSRSAKCYQSDDRRHNRLSAPRRN